MAVARVVIAAVSFFYAAAAVEVAFCEAENASADGDLINLPHVGYMSSSGRIADDAVSATFFNSLDYALVRYWDDGTPEGVYQGLMHPRSKQSCGTFRGHVFIFRRHGRDGRGKEDGEVARFTVEKGKTTYIIADEKSKRTEYYAKVLKLKSFSAEYFKNHGTPWVSYFDMEASLPRPRPKLHFWDAQNIGRRHTIHSKVPYWRFPDGGDIDSNLITPEITFVTLSLKPRVFLLQNVLSTEECDEIIRRGRSLVAESTIRNGANAYTDNSRTSKTGWMSRGKHGSFGDRLYRRFAEILNIPESILHSGKGGVAENLQVVHYLPGQKYTAHYDFYDNGKNANMRFLTLLIYLNDPQESDPHSPTGDGGTAFRKAFGGRGFQVRPQKGSAVLFYNMLPDGNGDVYSEHAGLPVPQSHGEKWVVNLWVWSPLFR